MENEARIKSKEIKRMSWRASEGLHKEVVRGGAKRLALAVGISAGSLAAMFFFTESTYLKMIIAFILAGGVMAGVAYVPFYIRQCNFWKELTRHEEYIEYYDEPTETDNMREININGGKLVYNRRKVLKHKKLRFEFDGEMLDAMVDFYEQRKDTSMKQLTRDTISAWVSGDKFKNVVMPLLRECGILDEKSRYTDHGLRWLGVERVGQGE